MQKITPFLWFKNQAVPAAKFYTSVFKKSKIIRMSSFDAEFKIGNLNLYAFNGGSYYKINPAISLCVECKTQKEIDYYWKKFSKGGKILQCGWVTDKFGVTWQIIPDILADLLGDRNREKADRAHDAMLKMKKLDIKKLKQAHAGRSLF